MTTPKETFELARAGERIPIGVTAGIAWLESEWDPECVTGRHVGLYQLVNNEGSSIYGDWLREGGNRVELKDPNGNAMVAGWGLARTAAVIRKLLDKYKVRLTDEEFWPLVYWAWLAGTSDVPLVINAYAAWLASDITKSPLARIPLVRVLTELEQRYSTHGQLWTRYWELSRAERWRPERIRQALEAGVIKPKLTADYVLNGSKTRHAERVKPYVRKSFEEIARALEPSFRKKYGRSPLESWARAAGWGALVACLVMLFIMLKR